jgi:hypothetical protein
MVFFNRISRFGGDVPPCFKVMMLVLCLFSHKNIHFAKYKGFKVLGYMCVSTKFHILFGDFKVT